MTLKGRIQVEQLDDERLTNIERKLVVAVSELRAPAPRASRRLLAFAGVTMAVTIAAVAGYKLREPAVAPLAEAPAVETPQRFAVHTADGRAHTVDLGDAQLVSGIGTDVVVERTRSRVVVLMERGSIDMTVAHDPSRVLIIRAGDTEIEDIGTHFTVDYDGGSHLAVRVTEGEVSVKRAGTHENITAGFAWTKAGGKLTLAAHDAATSSVIAMASPEASSPTGPSVPTASGSGAPSTATTTSTTATTPTTPAAATPTTTVRKAGRSNARVALEKLAIDEPLDVGSSDTSTAISKYLELAVGMRDTQDKTEVLYSMAVVQHRARQDKAALYTLTGVIKRQGGKAYRPALWLNVRIECMQRFDDECRQAADLYLRKIPDGVAAGVAQAILTEIGRQ